MPVMIISNFDDESVKYKRANTEIPFSHYKSNTTEKRWKHPFPHYKSIGGLGGGGGGGGEGGGRR